MAALPPLPDTAVELRTVAGKLGASDVHLGAAANETAVKRAALADYRIVYFATHGLVAGDVEELGEPALVLSLPKEPSELDESLSRRSMFFLAVAWFWGVKAPPFGYLMVLPALFLGGLMLGALGLLLSSMIKQLENFAGVMNFVIFPMYFASPALYPLWRIQEASPLLYKICLANPFSYAVELVRFAFYGQVNWISLAVVTGCTALFLASAIIAYDPSRGLMNRKQDTGGNG